MAIRDGFDLDADITMSELHQEELVTERLRVHHRLRVRRRNKVVGVLVDDQEWRALMARIRSLEDELERVEDAACRAIIAEREPHVRFEKATPEAVAEIQSEYERLIREQ